MGTSRDLRRVPTFILIVCDLFHPVDYFAVFFFLDSDVGHGGFWCGAVPMLFAGSEPDYVTGMNLLDGTAFALGPAAAGGDD